MQYIELKECGCCNCYHLPNFNGECRDDQNRFPTWQIGIATHFGKLSFIIDDGEEPEWFRALTAQEIKDFEQTRTQIAKDGDQHTKYGWGIFATDRGHMLMKIDDPEECDCVQTFDSDDEAAKWVQNQANDGDAVCRRAIDFLFEENSESVSDFQLVKTWTLT